MTLTKAQALTAIENLTNPTVAQIKNIVAQVDTSIPTGKTAYLYSGTLFMLMILIRKLKSPYFKLLII